MKTKFLLLSVVALICTLGLAAAAQSQSQSLGDYARAVKKTKPASSTQTGKVFDNDNLPAGDSVSVVGSPAAPNSDSTKDAGDASKDATKDQSQEKSANNSSDSASADTKADAKSDKKDEPQIKPGQSTEDRDAAIAALKKRLDEQKKKVDMLAQDVDLTKREYNLKAASFYSDPSRLSNPNSVYQDQDKLKQELAEKQKALDDAKAELSDMQEKARKQGAPESMLD